MNGRRGTGDAQYANLSIIKLVKAIEHVGRGDWMAWKGQEERETKKNHFWTRQGWRAALEGWDLFFLLSFDSGVKERRGCIIPHVTYTRT